MHEVEQVIKPATGIGRRPSVKFGLNLRYPPVVLLAHRQSAGVHRRICRHDSFHLFVPSLPPFAV
jgi:hypothetical protein